MNTERNISFRVRGVLRVFQLVIMSIIAVAALSVGLRSESESSDCISEGQFILHDEQSVSSMSSDMWVVAIAVHEGVYGFHVYPYSGHLGWMKSATSLDLLANHIATSIGVSDVFVDSQLQWESVAGRGFESATANPFDAIACLVSSLSGVECGIYLAIPVRYMPSRAPKTAVYFVRESVPLIIKPRATNGHRAFSSLLSALREAGLIHDDVGPTERDESESVRDELFEALEALAGGVQLDRDRSKLVANGSMLLLWYEQPVVLLMR